MLNTLVSLITALGVGGFIGAFFQSRFEQQKQLNEQERELKIKRYKAILILMLARLEPETALPKLKLEREDIDNLDDLDREIGTELFFAMLFASDEVIAAIAGFVGDAGIPTYRHAVAAMRRDLWGRKTSIGETVLSEAAKRIAAAGRRRA
jgi:hypothetical protein